jgi:hypothetical protein
LKIFSLTAFGFEEEYFTTHTITANITAAGDYSILVPKLSTAATSSALITSVAALPDEGGALSAPDLDLNEGTIYNVTVSYRDAVLNDANSATVGFIEFTGNATATPILTNPADESAVASSFNLSFTLPDIPLTGSIKLVLTAIQNDPVTVRTLTFVQNSAIEARGSHFMTFTNFHTAAADLAVVSTVSPQTELVDGAIYDLSLEYQDPVGNPKSSVTSRISFHGGESLPLRIISPANSSCLKTAFNFTFVLPEKAFEDSLKLTITPTGGKTDSAGARTIIFEEETAGVRTIAGGAFQQLSGLAGLADVKSISPATDLIDGGVYSILLEYRDAAQNDRSTAFLTGLTFCGDTTLDLATHDS